ncbi:MAG: hypothetical protein WC695_08695 [Candidatus Omnitrophota bacterium]
MKVVDLAKRLDVKVENVLEIIRAGGIEVKGGEDELQIAAISKIVRDICRSVPSVNRQKYEKELNPSLFDLALNLNDELDRITAEARFHSVRLKGPVYPGKQSRDSRAGDSSAASFHRPVRLDKKTVEEPVKLTVSLSGKIPGLACKAARLLGNRYVISGIILFLSVALLLAACFIRLR